MSGNSPHQLVTTCFLAGCRAVDPQRLVEQSIAVDASGLQIGVQAIPCGSGRLVFIGAGKAVTGMARGLLRKLRDTGWDMGRVCGWINVPDQDACELPPLTVWPCRPVGENLPTERSVEATREIVRLVEGLKAGDLCVCLISGGGSALLAEPVAGITLDDKRELIRWLDWSGADIRERNQVRRELSTVKGGRLRARAGPGRMITLVISDVLGDPLELVASGPTVPTVSRPDLALEILERLAGGSPVAAGVPEAVVECLTRQCEKKLERGKPDFRGAKGDTQEVVLLGNLRRAAEAAAEQGGRLGFPVQTVIQSDPHETVGDAAVRIVAWIREQPAGKRMLVDAGEPILRLGDSPGRGGRNQHLVLEVAKRLLDEGKPMPERWCVLSAGTDGEDGNTAAAGGIIDGNWMDGMKDRSQEIDAALEGFNSATLLATTGGQLVTGPTGTNVGDLRIVVLE